MSNIDYTKHKDKRKNNPTIENRNFFVKEENAPYAAKYSRDPSLDPQLVWTGKDEQDQEDLAVPTVPIYIQEKILPAAVIEEVASGRWLVNKNGSGPGTIHDPQSTTPSLFGDFNGLELEAGEDKFEKEVEFYEHDKNWSNRMILGDSLLVMNSLAEKEGLKGKVQCIYIDPPYGIKFGSNWQVSTRKRDVKDGKAEDAAREPEVVRAFRDTWKLGIHSYLSYLRDRFRVAQELLTETGSIFVQIGDENVHLVRCVLDEVFGSENFVGQLTIAKTAGTSTDDLAGICDYLVWFAKDRNNMKYRQLFLDKQFGAGADEYRFLLMPDGSSRSMTKDEIDGVLPIPDGAERFRPSALTSQRPAQGTDLREFVYKGKSYSPGAGTYKTDLAGLTRLANANRIVPRFNSLSYLRKLDDFPVMPLHNVWLDVRWGFDASDKRYVVETNPKVAARCILMATDPGDLVLDPTCGSGTTAYVAEQWGRRWITIDTSRVALALARTRLMSAKFPYYLLADSPEGAKRESELTRTDPPNHPNAFDIRKGFVYESVPHVTLKSIANNPDIKEGMSREAIDAAIAKHADTELLFDKPYQDKKRIRVTGPFTVESLSPHRVMADSGTSDGAKNSHDSPSGLNADELSRTGDFTQMVLDNLRKAGVQNTKKNERLKFDDIQPHAGTWIHAKSTYTPGGEGKTLRVAISVGPEYGAVSPMQIKEAAKEAMQGLGHDILVVCGYAFDPHVSEEAKHYGELTVLPTRMNADLLMADDLLKKTGAGNLFMVFGEPDLDVARDGDMLTVTIRGIDIFDPTTGEIRSGRAVDSSTGEDVSDVANDIACWFIDTNYNGESFFVRHAYFTGADEPYNKLKKALRAEVDEAAWASLYSTVSRPFPVPETGKIAVKVINHYGDEVLKVYGVESSTTDG